MALYGGRMINWCLCTLQWFSLGYVVGLIFDLLFKFSIVELTIIDL
jgi:hypothetical protein